MQSDTLSRAVQGSQGGWRRNVKGGTKGGGIGRTGVPRSHREQEGEGVGREEDLPGLLVPDTSRPDAEANSEAVASCLYWILTGLGQKHVAFCRRLLACD